MKVRGIFPRIAVFIFILHRETPAGPSPFIINSFENIEPHALIRIGDTGFSISYLKGFVIQPTSRKNPNTLPHHRRFSLSFFDGKYRHTDVLSSGPAGDMIEPCDIVFIRRLVTIDQIPFFASSNVIV